MSKSSGKSSPATKKSSSSSVSSPQRTPPTTSSSVSTPVQSSSTYFPTTSSVKSLDSTTSSQQQQGRRNPAQASPVQPLPPIRKPYPCSLMQEVAWMHNLRHRCMQNTIRALSGHGKRQFRQLETWEELLDILRNHADDDDRNPPQSTRKPQAKRRGKQQQALDLDLEENSDTALVVTHALELLYAVGDDHGEDWLPYVEDSSAMSRLQLYIGNAPGPYYRRQAALVYMLLNGKRRLEPTDPALDVFAEIYSAFHARLAPDNDTPYPCWEENSNSTLYYSRLDALSPLPRSPGPGSPKPGSPTPGSPGGGRVRSTSPGRLSPGREGRLSPGSPGVTSSGMLLPGPSSEAIEAGFATRYSDTDPFAMLSHANKVLRMCWEPSNLQQILAREVAQNAIGILGNENPFVAFYGEAFFHSIFSHGRFLYCKLEPAYLPAVIIRIKGQISSLQHAEGNLQCLRVLIDGDTPQHAAFAQQEVDEGVVELCLQLLLRLTKLKKAREGEELAADWRVLPHVSGILRCIVHHGANEGKNKYRPLFDSAKGLATLTTLVPLIPNTVSGVDSICLTVCGLLKGDKPTPAKMYGPVLQIVASNKGSQRHHAQYNDAWAGMDGAEQALAEYKRSGGK